MEISWENDFMQLGASFALFGVSSAAIEEIICFVNENASEDE